jgi:mannosyltransferase OCH1-like enzyme
MKIPKRLGHIWIGPKSAPVQWMQTWVDKHPDWEYTLYDNAFLRTGTFRTQAQIDEYMKRGWYAGAADLLRYEILYEHGGYLAEADSICLEPIDELLADGASLYTVYENEFVRGQLVSPVVAAAPKHPFLKAIIDRLSVVPPTDLDHPWKQTGNLFVAELIEELKPEITIWPSYTLIPVHFEGRVYNGPGKIHAKQLFGETTRTYQFSSVFARLKEKRKALYASRARKHLRALRKSKQSRQ